MIRMTKAALERLALVVLVAGTAATAVLAYLMTGGGTRGLLTAALVAVVAVVAVTVMNEAERRASARENSRRLHIPDGFVLAYELCGRPGRPGRPGTVPGGAPYVIVAAVPAEPWDLTDARWRFSVVEHTFGLVVHLPPGGLAGVSAMGGFFAEFDEGGLRDLAAVCRSLSARGGREIRQAGPRR